MLELDAMRRTPPITLPALARLEADEGTPAIARMRAGGGSRASASVNGSTARGSMSGAERTVEERVRSMTYIAEWHLERAEQAELEGHERDCRRHQQMAKQAYRVVDMLKKERQASTASV